MTRPSTQPRTQPLTQARTRHRGRDLKVDWTRCDGHGLCARLFPERIELDEWGFPVIDGTDLAADEMRTARLAVRSCPRLALTIERSAATTR